MPNIIKADCGFDPHDMDAFQAVSVDSISDPEGFWLEGHKNMIVDLSAESGDVTIEDFNCMKPGMEYKIVATNGASTQHQLIFPSASTIYNGEITPANGMTILYRFFTDGQSIFCKREIYS